MARVAHPDIPAPCAIRIEQNGRLWIDGTELPNYGWTLSMQVDSIATLRVEIPVAHTSLPADAQVEVIYVASLGPDLDIVSAEAATAPAALRALADALEARG